ncbi:MAG TPA: tetratricopeptide repeat protein [Steroidobacteraceae bacterium]|nr:tetratricopeptide repeat protein [Steroidobacteraceae bacterium]
MEEYLSERQQIDWLRATLRENAPWALASVLITVGLFVGYQQWKAWGLRQADAADQKYEATLNALARGDADGAGRIVKELRESYARTPYADLAALALARFHVEGGRLGDAAALLEAVLKQTRDAELATVVRLRLARVQRADGKTDAALATLAGAPAGSASPAYADVRGDLLLDKGDKAGALAAWREALAAKSAGVNRELIELKIAALEPAAAPAGAGQKP